MWFLGLGFLLLAFPASGGEVLPTAEDINKLAEGSKATADDFITATNELRFQYEYSGKFLNRADRERLGQLAKSASERLEEIAQSQRKLKAAIEEYEGDDWEKRYGETGLWRKLFGELYATGVRKLEADLYVALCAESPDKQEMLRGMLAEIDALRESYDGAYLQLVRAKTLGLLWRAEAAYKSQAEREFSLLSERSDMKYSTVLRIVIERTRQFGLEQRGQLSALAEQLARSGDANDVQLVLSLACLQHRLDMPGAFEKTVGMWRGRIENFVKVLVLHDLGYRLEQNGLDLENTSLFEAELAALAAWGDVPEDWESLLRRISNSDKFQTPLILYVTALASAKAQPLEAGELLIKAARLQKAAPSAKLDIEPGKIAEQAGKLACNAYAGDRLDGGEVLGILESYRQIAAGWTDDELEYCYATALMAAGQKEKGAELLRKIAETSQARRACRAKLDLIISIITRDHYTDPDKRAEVSKDLLDLLGKCIEPNDPAFVRPEAIRIYCRLLLEYPQANEAQKILNILTDSEIRNDPNLSVFKSKALRYLDRLEESAECLVEICRADNREHALEAERLVIRIIERFEHLQGSSSDPARLQKNSLEIARYCERISLTTYGLIPTGKLYVAEISLWGAAKEPQELAKIEKMLDGLPERYKSGRAGFVRCRARLLAAQGKFAEAGGLWAKVASIEKSRSGSGGRRNGQWWRARYYEIYCFSKMPQTQSKDVVHGIEVLLNSYAEIPPLWAEKLGSLKSAMQQE